VMILDLESVARPNSLRNRISSRVRAYIRGQRVFVGDVEGTVVLAMRIQGVAALVAGRKYY
jgi:hypothetical protein